MNALRVLAGFSIIGGILQILSPIWYHLLDTENQTVVLAGGTLDLISMVFILLGMISIFTYRNQSSTNWTASFIAAFIGTVLVTGTKMIHAFVEPALMEKAPELLQAGPPSPIGEAMFLSFVLFALSWIYFSVSSIRAKAFPLTGSILILLAPILDFIPIGSILAQSVWGLGIIWLSLSVIQRKDHSTSSPETLSF